MSLLETEDTHEKRVERVPLMEVLKRQSKQVLLTALLRLPEQAPGYLVGTFIFTYGTSVLGMTRAFQLVGVLTEQTALVLMWCRRPAVGRDSPQADVHQWPDTQIPWVFSLLCRSGLLRHELLDPEAALIASSLIGPLSN